MDTSPLNAIIAARAKGKKIKPWVPQEENSLYVRTPTNTVFITNSDKLKVQLSPGSNQIELPERSLKSNILSPYVSWHGKEGTLSVKGLKDTSLTKQTAQEYFEDIVPSISRDEMAGTATCILEVTLPMNGHSYQEIAGYEDLKRRISTPLGVAGKIKNEPYLIEHPTDIVLSGEAFQNRFISALVFVHCGTNLAPWTLERVVDDLICEPVTITNSGYKGAVNCTLLLRSLGSIEEDAGRAYPIVFSVKSSDLSKQLFFEASKY